MNAEVLEKTPLTQKGTLRILWIEDIEDDAVLQEMELKKSGIKFTPHRVDTAEGLLGALNSFKPEVILSDHSLPQFSSSEAFRIYRESGVDIPFILVTGTVSEQFAVDCLKLGMDDYVLKSNLQRLPSAVLSAVHRREMERSRAQREREIAEQNDRLEEEVKRRTQELSMEKDFVESIVNSMPGVFYVLKDQKVIRWNKNLEETTGYKDVEIGKLSLLDLVDDKKTVEKQIQRIIRVGFSNFEATIKTRDGKSIPHYFTGMMREIGGSQLIVGMAVNIEELKNVQEKLRLHDERLALAFSNSNSSWWDLDLIARKLDFHPNRYIALGYTNEETSQDFSWSVSLIHPDDVPAQSKSMEDCLSGKSPVYEAQLRMRCKDGSWKWYQVIGKIVTWDAAGKPVRMIGMSNDISKTKQIEGELVDAKMAAESANQTKGQFLANMSHEIRTPMNAIIGLTHLTQKTALNPKQQDYLKKIQSSSESLLSIINDILDFSKIEAGKLTLEEVPFDLEEVFQRMADVITYKAYSKGLEIAFGLDRNVTTKLAGDPVRLEQILTNLCSNAVKFTDKGEVVVKAKLVDDCKEFTRIQFTVTDTGIGMDKAQLSRLFEPFTQADNTISRKYGGTGLGLSIIKRLVELMGGTVGVKSKPGVGSEFCFTANFRKQEAILPKPKPDLRNLRVLLVDDNKSAEQILKEALESLSFDVVSVNSGSEAIHFLKNNHAAPPVEVVMIDWKMPEMDGIRTAEIIKQDEQLKHLKIIMMCTSYANEELYQKVEALKLSGVLAKPIRYSRLYDTIIQAILSEGVSQKPEVQNLIFEEAPVAQGHLLLVEDNEINQQVASELLERFGFTVDIAGNGIEAIEKVTNSGKPSKYDLVLMDLQMPLMGGYKATTEIRKLNDYKDLPIIAMTADAMSGVKEKCIETGMMDFLTKPINPVRMLEVIQKYIQPQKRGLAAPNGGRLAFVNGTDEISLPTDLPGIDIEDGLSHVGGNKTFYYGLLVKFKENHMGFIQDLKKDFLAGNKDQLRRSIHTLKGLSANLGMTRLHESCKAVEIGIQMGVASKSDFDVVTLEMSVELQMILGILSERLPRPVDTTPGEEPETDLKSSLIKLEKLLKDQDPDAVQLIDELENLKGHKKEITRLKNSMKKYDFDSAIQILEEIKVHG